MGFVFESYLASAVVVSPQGRSLPEPIPAVPALREQQFDENAIGENAMLTIELDRGVEGWESVPAPLLAEAMPSGEGGRSGQLSPDEARRQPILSAFGPDLAAQFTWTATTDTIESYEHGETLRLLHIDRVTGECFNQSCEVISKAAALEHALRPRVRTAPQPVEEIITPVIVEPTYKAVSDGTMSRTPGSASEPDLNAFVRRAAWEEANADAVEPHQAAVSSGLNRLLTNAKHDWLGKVWSWNRPLMSDEQDAAAGHAQNTQEPNLATFTRRASAI